MKNGKGTLVIVGGNEDKEKDCVILKKFVELAKGPKARIVVMTVATTHPEETGKLYIKVFRRLGVAHVDVVDASQRIDAFSQKGIENINQSTGVFFTGGDQFYIPAFLGASPMAEVIQEKRDSGTVIGGTSAGAAMMSDNMLISGDSNSNPKRGAARFGPGMNFIEDAVIDTHFSERGRHGRLETAVAHAPQYLGIGIEENTAAIVDGSSLTVLGPGAVTIIDGGPTTYNSLPYTGEGESFSIFNITLHVLSEGCAYDLKKRQPSYT